MAAEKMLPGVGVRIVLMWSSDAHGGWLSRVTRGIG